MNLKIITMVETTQLKANKIEAGFRFHYFVGIDVSKDKLNGTLLMQGRAIKSIEIANQTSGFKKLEKWLKAIPGYQADRLVICMESTSIYHLPLANYMSQQKVAKVWVENATEIKRSMGIRRGQNDKADARNIAEYAFRHQDKLRKPTNCIRRHRRPLFN